MRERAVDVLSLRPPPAPAQLIGAARPGRVAAARSKEVEP